MQLSLDHITVTDTTPSQLADLAAMTGCSGICPFLRSMDVLPAMPAYDLVTDKAERQATKAALAAGGLTVDLVYPFTMAGRTVVADFEPSLEAVADLGGTLANVLCYDRDPLRRVERLDELAGLAAGYGVALAIEFYPPAQVRTLAEVMATIESTGRTDIGVTLDLLHVMRGGAAEESTVLLADPRICIAQLSDGPATIAAERIEWEAGIQRLLPGDGTFDIPGFLRALRPGVPVSVEAPQQAGLEAGVSSLDRARRAVEATRRCREPLAT
ncbi:MAG: sugar phosphate isomerase/epimerase [Novosphingobium sp.]